jgi:LCP family protein required for cell wall assembly
MSRDPDNRTETEDPPYRVFRGEGGSRQEPRERPYRTYRSAPRGLRARLRGEDDAALSIADHADEPSYKRFGGRGGGRGGEDGRGSGGRRFRGPFTWKRGLAWLGTAIVVWVLFSLVLFFISAQTHSGDLPAGTTSALSSGGPMLTSANTVLILGLDNRPTTGVDSKEGGGAETSERDARTDTIMLWRIGGGVSRRLSIPRDTLVNIPGIGESKINAAWSESPKLALQVIENFTGLKINHVIVVDLANFPNFINDVGGVTVKTGKICSNISGGVAKGGFTLDLSAGVHHLNGEQAEILARTRDNSCNIASTDLTREAMQQQILNSIKSQLLTIHTFLHLPWVAWDAPGVVQTDMGGLTMLQLFLASEIGGSAPPALLSENNETLANGEDVLVPNAANVHAEVQKFLTGN